MIMIIDEPIPQLAGNRTGEPWVRSGRYKIERKLPDVGRGERFVINAGDSVAIVNATKWADRVTFSDEEGW